MLMLHIQNVVFHLKRKLVGIAIGTATAVGQPVNAAFLIAIKDLVAGLAGYAELPTKFRHLLARQTTGYELNSLIHHRTLLPRHPLPPEKGRKCNLCVRY